jgi:hypothetical protein
MSEMRYTTLPAESMLGVLGRELTVRVLNGSPSGCLLETNARLEVGTVASVRITMNGVEFVDDIQVVRCQQVGGAGSVFHIGAQFLWTATPHQHSLRQVLRRAVVPQRLAPTDLKSQS